MISDDAARRDPLECVDLAKARIAERLSRALRQLSELFAFGFPLVYNENA